MKTIAMEFDHLMRISVDRRITDIHFMINKKKSVVLLRRLKQFECNFESVDTVELFNYLKYLSGIEYSSLNSPKSVQFVYQNDEKELYLRLAIIETRTQIHAVLRILNQVSDYSLENCGFKSHDQKLIQEFYSKPNGLLIFSGSTGSGKSTSMFSSLDEVKNLQILTLENPVEQVFDTMIQIDTRSQDLEKFVTQILRHDPDVIVIGEVRTEHELQQCLRCVLTGHKVVTTIHAGSLEDVLFRIKDLNKTLIPFESLLYGIVHQSLKKEGDKVELNATIQVY